MTPIRKRLIEITAGMADEPAETMELFENYIQQLVIDEKIATYKAIKSKILNMEICTIYEQIASESRALSLYYAGKHGTEIAEILSEEYPELDGDQIDKIINDAYEIFKEKSIILENKTND